MIADARTLDERYARATHAADLKPAAERRVDVDYIIAAGFAQESLGTKLYRLASEWDLAAGDYRLASRHVRTLEAEASQIQRNLRRAPAQDAEALLRKVDDLISEARDTAVTAKAMALVHLKTLQSTADALGEFANWHATKTAFMEPPAAVNGLASRALRLWLDATCPACQGRGFNGGFNGPKVLCPTCSATGRAHHSLNRREPHAAFVRSLLAQMDRKVEIVDRQMRRWLRLHP
jgi:hypothetical protein